ncbi:MAG: T9SS type A sorting domain-containing protein [Balneolaceae bacterium]
MMDPEWRWVAGRGHPERAGALSALFLVVLFGYCALPTPLQAQYVPEREIDPDAEVLNLYDEVIPLAAAKAERILAESPSGSAIHPTHADPVSGIYERSGVSEWTSGFFPGMLWMLYEATGESVWLKRAREWTDLLEPEATRNGDHDHGFRILSSFGRGWALTGDRAYRRIVRQAAGTLASRYNKQIGAIRSWDWFRTYPVIIDNMMNLELLLEAGSWSPVFDTYREIALVHGETTRQHHLREDGSHVHIVDFSESGQAQWKGTIQGYGPESTWARGQAWGIYGFATLFRYGGRAADLQSACEMAGWFLDHLPPEGVPFYDFEDPDIPHVTRDASAAAIAASALLELYGHTGEARWLEGAERILLALGGPDHLSRDPRQNALLVRSTRWRGDPERGIIYGDYYFLEALSRYAQMAGVPMPEMEREWPVALYAPYPNPARGEVTFDVALEESSRIRLELFTVTGRRVALLVDEEELPAGSHQMVRDLSRLASGLYLVRLTSGDHSRVRKLILLR